MKVKEARCSDSASITLTNVQSSDAGWYRVKIANSFGSTWSQPALLTVTTSPVEPDPLESWTRVHHGDTGSGSLWSVIYANGSFLAVGDSGTILCSTNGTSWDQIAAGLDAVPLRDVTYANGLYVMIGGGENATVWTSTDGEVWTERYRWNGDLSIGFFSALGVVYAGDHFLGYGSDRGRFPRWIVSDDGITWSMVPNNISSQAPLGAFAYGDGLYEALLRTPMVVRAVSTNFVNWTESIDEPYSSAVAFGNHRFVFLDAVSTNGYDLIRSNRDPEIRYLSFAGGMFFGTGYYGKLATSTDGLNWRDRDSGTDAALFDSASDGETTILVGEADTILVSGNAHQLQLLSPEWSEKVFQVSVQGEAGATYVLQRKESVSGPWTDISSVANDGGAVLLTDRNSTNSRAIYRVKQN